MASSIRWEPRPSMKGRPSVFSRSHRKSRLSMKMVDEFAIWGLRADEAKWWDLVSRATPTNICVTVFLFVSMGAFPFALPLGEPYTTSFEQRSSGFYVYMLVANPYSVTLELYNLGTFVCAILDEPLGTRQLLFPAGVGGATCGLLIAVASFGLGFFPVPFTLVFLAPPCLLVWLGVLFLTFPPRLRREPAFRYRLFRAAFIAVMNVMVAVFLVLYYAAFAQAKTVTGQTLFALSLPVLKWSAKRLTQWATGSKHNNNFIHGAGFYSEAIIGAFSAVLFTQIQDSSTFVLLVLADVVENIHLAYRIVQVVIVEKDESARKVEVIMSDKGSTQASKVFAALQQSASKGLQQHPHLLAILGYIVFAELAEVVVPVVMAFASLLLYYWPTGVKQYFSYMSSVSEEQFLKGMVYVLLEATVESLTLLVTTVVIHDLTGINIISLCRFIISKHQAYFFTVIPVAVLWFHALFLSHNGLDLSFKFKFERPDSSLKPNTSLTGWNASAVAYPDDEATEDGGTLVAVMATLCAVGVATWVLAHAFLYRARNNAKVMEQERSLKSKELKMADMSSQMRVLKQDLEAAKRVVQEVMSSGISLDRWSVAHTEIDFGKPLGEGSFGTVYKAAFRGREVAVKTMRVGKLSTQIVRKFKMEIMIMAPLSHENLIRMYGASWQEGPDKLCLVLEFAGSGTLIRVMNCDETKGSWDTPRRGYAIGIASCFEYLHGLNEPLIHRDLKPENVLIANDGLTPKVADFGESTHFSVPTEEQDPDFQLTMTQVGTPLYCAPEVADGGRYNASVDVFSFGLTLLEIALGDPYYIASQVKLMRIRGSSGMLLYHNWRPPIPVELSEQLPNITQLVERCWSHTPANRPVFSCITPLLRNDSPRAKVQLSGHSHHNMRAALPTSDERTGEPRASSGLAEKTAMSDVSELKTELAGLNRNVVELTLQNVEVTKLWEISKSELAASKAEAETLSSRLHAAEQKYSVLEERSIAERGALQRRIDMLTDQLLFAGNTNRVVRLPNTTQDNL